MALQFASRLEVFDGGGRLVLDDCYVGGGSRWKESLSFHLPFWASEQEMLGSILFSRLAFLTDGRVSEFEEVLSAL